MAAIQVHRMPPKITIVVAAYNRGRVLSRTLRTAIAQTEADWHALVIGDACTDDTQAQIAALGDDRIRFINLPERFGEQAGPNSVGMALAQSNYVAFLNQDDYWFPNHLALAIDALDTSGADLFWSRAAFFTNRGAWSDRAFFCEASPKGRRLEDMFDHPTFLSEPFSTWVARRDALHRLGPMKLASQTAQVPIVEYGQRAYRMGASLEVADEISVLKDNVWHMPPNYRNSADYGEVWVKQLESGQTDDLRQAVERDLWLSHALGLNRSFAPISTSKGQARRAFIDRDTGLNLADMQQAAQGRPSPLLNQSLIARTGETLQHQPNLEDMIAFARRAS